MRAIKVTFEFDGIVDANIMLIAYDLLVARDGFVETPDDVHLLLDALFDGLKGIEEIEEAEEVLGILKDKMKIFKAFYERLLVKNHPLDF